MTRNFARRLSALSVILLSTAISTSLLASVAAAQLTDAGQPSRKPQMLAGPSAVDSPGRVLHARLRPKMFGGRAPDAGDPFFLPAVPYGSGGDTYAMAVADVNRDGKLDVLVVNFNSNTVGVLLGNGDGIFQPVQTYYPGAAYPTSIAVADVNADGSPDVLVANDTYDYRLEGVVGVLLGNGNGTFQPVVTYSSGDRGAMSIAVADVNGDHKADLLVANDLNVAVLLGNGDGTFGVPHGYDSGGQYNVSVAVADLNGDGKLDLVAAAAVAGFNSVGILLGNGDGTFQPPVTFGSGGINPEFVAVADVNGDSRPDILVANTDSNTVGVLLSNGDGTFEPAVTYGSGGTNAAAIAVADVNGDGKPDLLATNNCVENQACGSGEGVLGVLLGNGDGTFQPAVTYDSGGGAARSIAATDVNGDGKPDALIANNIFCENNYCGAGVVAVLLNNYGPHRATVTTLASSLNPSVFGQSITFTSTVSSSYGVPTGTVTFYDGPTALGSAKLVEGSALLSNSTLSAGSHLIVAAYEGSGKFERSASVRLNEVVHITTTTLSLTSSINPAVINQVVTYTATVAGEYGGAASGDVTFLDNGRKVATVFLAGNLAVYSRSYKANGVHPITVVYGGDANNTGSTSPTLTEYVKTLPVASKTKVTTSGSPSLFGQPVTFTAIVTSIYGSIPDSELITFYDGTATLGSVTLAGGVASYTTSSLAAKSHYIKATYGGDAIFKTSSAHLWQTVSK